MLSSNQDSQKYQKGHEEKSSIVQTTYAPEKTLVRKRLYRPTTRSDSSLKLEVPSSDLYIDKFPQDFLNLIHQELCAEYGNMNSGHAVVAQNAQLRSTCYSSFIDDCW